MAVVLCHQRSGLAFQYEYAPNGAFQRNALSLLYSTYYSTVFYPFLNPTMSFIIISNLNSRTMHPLKDDIMYIKIADFKVSLTNQRHRNSCLVQSSSVYANDSNTEHKTRLLMATLPYLPLCKAKASALITRRTNRTSLELRCFCY